MAFLKFNVPMAFFKNAIVTSSYIWLEKLRRTKTTSNVVFALTFNIG